MSFLQGLRARARMLLRRRAAEQELEEEVSFHLDREEERNRRLGMSAAEARRAARLSFGSADRFREEARDEWPSSLFRGLAEDARYGLRRLIHQPAFTAAALLTLALGIGANAAVFGLVRGVLRSPLPYGAPDRLVVLWERTGSQSSETWLSAREWLEYQAATARSFAQLAAYTDLDANLTEGGEPERVRAARVTGNLFATLAVPAARGRTFTAAEDNAGHDDVVVLGWNLWQRRFGADPGIVGRAIRVNGRPRTVLGVMPAGFRLPLDYREAQPTELWVPAAIDRTADLPFGDRSYYLIGRLREGVTPARATAALDQTMHTWIERGFIHANNEPPSRAALPLDGFLARGVAPALRLLFGAVLLVLLVACANVAHLMLARSDARRREMATRAALGAGRLRILRQLLVESGLLAGMGALLGLLLAWLGTRATVALTPVNVIRTRGASLDAAVLLYTALLTVAATLLAGLTPALRLARVEVAAALRSSRGDVAPLRRRLRQGLVVLESCLSVVLVIGAGLLARSFGELRQIQLGFDPHDVLTFRVELPTTSYPEVGRVIGFPQQLLARLERLPRVRAAGAARVLPLSDPIGNWSLTLENHPAAPGQNIPADWQIVSPGYFEAMRLQLRAGRFLTRADGADAPLVAVVNQTMAQRYWPGEDPIGKRFHLGTLNQPWIEIVGVTRDVRRNAVIEDPRPEMYLPHAQFARDKGGGAPSRGMTFVIRTERDPLALVPAVRAQVRALDPTLPIAEVRTMRSVAAAALAQARFTTILVAAFAGLALVLAAIGLYGVIAFIAARRTREIGIRMALGARSRSIAALVMTEGLTLAAAGTLLGLAVSVWTTRFLAGQLYGVSRFDALTFALVPAILLATAALASYLPARRAARVAPHTALRTD